MRKISFKVRNIGSEKYLSYILNDDCEFDEELLDYLEENREIVRALVRGTGVEGFGRKMITVLEECHLEMRPFRSVEDAYAARFLATGIVGMMEKWITEPQPIPKNEIVELINRVLTGNLI